MKCVLEGLKCRRTGPRATISLAMAIAAGLALSGGAAVAQSWYVKGFGGATLPRDDSYDLGFFELFPGDDESPDDAPRRLSVESGLDYDAGYVVGIAGGYLLMPNVAIELEYAFRNAETTETSGQGSSVTTQSNAWMANAIYYFPPLGAAGAWQPYAGGGLGAADLDIGDVSPMPGGDFDSDYNFAYQLIGGVAYAVNPNWKINGGVRCFGINDQDLENDIFEFKTTYHTFDLLIGATYAF
jgi:opacity protein-like surface antigen